MFESLSRYFWDAPYGSFVVEIVSDAVKSDPETWSAAVLGEDPSEYATKILDTFTWGGFVDINILSDHYKCQIMVLMCETKSILR